MSRDQNVAAQERLGDSVNAGNLEPLREIFADDVVDHDPAPDQGPGPQGFIDFFTTLRTAFPDAHIEAEQLVVGDDHVAIAYTLTGTHQGVFRGVSGTGHKVKVRGVQVARFVGGRIVERWGSTDELGILAQIDAA